MKILVKLPEKKRTCRKCRKVFVSDETHVHICHDCDKRGSNKETWMTKKGSPRSCQ